MAQIRGTAGYNLGHQNPFGGPGRADATNDPSPLDAIREQTSKIEDWLDTMSDPVKPYVSLIFYASCSIRFVRPFGLVAPCSHASCGIRSGILPLTPCLFADLQVPTRHWSLPDCRHLH